MIAALVIVAWGDPSARAAVPGTMSGTAAVQAQTVSFAAAGDLGANTRAAASLSALDGSGVDFFLALGDMDYDETPSDSAWCDYVKQRLPTLGSSFPFQLVSGNHEEQGGPDGYILNHAACLPDRMNSTGIYAAEYFFDYPASSPLVRAIMVAADLRVGNVDYNYTVGSSHYNWLASAIDSARAAGIPWVVVGVHKNCITAGDKPCEIGAQLMNLLVEKKVDLVFQGHDHNYQRSKQLAQGTGCAAVPAGSYNAACVADDGADGAYGKGAGMLLVVSGTFGRCCYTVNSSDPESGYFSRSNDNTYGFTRIDLTATRLDGRFVNTTGSFTDSFSVSATAADSDGDGFDGSVESHVGTDPADPCGNLDAGGASASWPADFATGGMPSSTDRVTISDLTSFLAPNRRLNSSPGQPAYNVRWDLVPGTGASGSVINIQDLTEILVLAPPMFGGRRAFNGPACNG
jgi:hypothetical protein